MDRPIEASELSRRRRRRITQIAVTILVIAGAWWGLGAWLRPTVERRALRIARVERGPIDQTVEAAGTVEPGSEQVITSPIEARVLKVLRHAGDTVLAGQPILQLDTAVVALERERVLQQLALKRNRQRQLQLETAQKLTDLRAETKSQQLQLEYLQTKQRQNEALFQQGLASQDAVGATQLQLDQARATLEKLQTSASNAEASFQAQLEGVGLEVEILVKEQAALEAKLAHAGTSGETAGVLTSLSVDSGASLRAGDEIARVADLHTFRVRATVSDLHAASLSAGLPALVRLDDEALKGTVTSVLPAVLNGAVTMLIELEQASHPALRVGRRVEVEVITAHRNSSLIARRGPGLAGTGRSMAFVIDGDKAWRKPIVIGLTNLDWCEVTEGVNEGDELIVSDIRAWEHVDSLVLR